MDGLGRLVKFLVHKKVFDEMPQPEKRNEKGEKAYSLNYCSKWWLYDTNATLAPMVMLRTNPITELHMHALNRSIKEGAISKETGKVVIVEIVQHSTKDDYFNDIRFTYDLMMYSLFSNGKERTESEWKKLLIVGGFCRYNIIQIPALLSIIEAFPQ
ncbi:(R,S)-reticuline 7-O-methyltransferase-like [Cynara cardunculus var. scolymus]|uniref:O-methyltransferase, family 2 n=1 Tax=Cynara cardunculus var. scolymus TaxID=59895 RepID=A0A103Y816_CYNCS|nr:(R,S)-reticuline 7-O-methyltransferase-like [Cynara cardunculus var. scolymus]KVI04222.1 O-methyltransferase, family 2 [Cynara cardunculus var. scolymus]